MLWAQNKSGSWNSQYNRMCYYMMPSLTSSAPDGYGVSAGDWQWGTYVNQNDTGPAHFYHNLNFDTESGQPMLMCQTVNPTQEVGVTGGGNDWGNQPFHIGWQVANPPSVNPGSGRYLFDANALTYFNGYYQMGGARFYPITWSSEANAPEEPIQGRALYYSKANSKYNIYVQGPKSLVVAGAYEFRYSTASMKTNGYSTGICTSNNSTPGTSPCPAGDTTSMAGSAFAGVKFTSGTVTSPPSTVYWAIKPIGTSVMSTTGNGQNPTYVITDQNQGFQVGDHVTVASVPGNTAANVTNQAITAVQAAQFWFRFNPTDQGGSMTSGPLVSIVSDSASPPNCTVTLNVNHNIFPGWMISVYGTPGNGPWQNVLESYYKVATTPTAQTFTFVCAASDPSTTWNTDADDAHFVWLSVKALPGFGYAVAGNGSYNNDTTNYNKGGTFTSTEDTRNFAEIAFTPPASAPVTPTGSTVSGHPSFSGSPVIH
jgi:hypothetical protein